MSSHLPFEPGVIKAYNLICRPKVTSKGGGGGYRRITDPCVNHMTVEDYIKKKDIFKCVIFYLYPITFLIMYKSLTAPYAKSGSDDAAPFEPVE